MSKRARDSRRSRRKMGMEEELQKIGLVGASNTDNPSILRRWEDVEDGTLPPRSPRKSPSQELPSQPTGSDAGSIPDVHSLAEHSGSNGSATTLPHKKFKTRDGATPNFLGDSLSMSSSYDMETITNLNTPDSVFKWARGDEAPPPGTVLPPRGRDDMDEAGSAVLPAQQPSRISIFQPVHVSARESPRLIESPPSSDSSELFIENNSVENGIDEEEVFAQAKGHEESSRIASIEGADYYDEEDVVVVAEKQEEPRADQAKATEEENNSEVAFVVGISKSESFPMEDDSQEEEGLAGVQNTPIFIPIATLVDADHSNKATIEKRPWYKRRGCWVLLLAPIIVATVVLVVVFTVRGKDDDQDSSTDPGDDLDESPTVTPLLVTLAPTLGDSGAPPVPAPSMPFEFPNVSDTFQQSYTNALAWLGLNELRQGDAQLQRFVLAWLWYHTTENGDKPWTHCNPEEGGSEQCDHLSSLQVDNLELCFASASQANRWLTSANECLWAGVTCNESGIVTAIKLPGMGVHGAFPFFLDRLSLLEELDLSFGSLDGSLPLSIGGFSNLQVLDLSHNRVAGSVPEELGSLLALRKLSLAYNLLTGATIPSALGGLVNLQDLDVSRSSLGGNIPSEFSNLSSIVRINLHGNYLTGALPTLEWPLLEELYLQDNNFDSFFPSEILTLSAVRVVDLSNNHFRGEVTDQFVPSMVLEVINLENNLFWGPIPLTLSVIPSLTSVRVNLNRFDGAVPEGLCTLREMDANGFRDGLEVLEADCLLNIRGIVDNNCSCCTTCCDRTTNVCTVNEDTQIAPDSSTQVCVQRMLWDRVNGALLK